MLKTADKMSIGDEFEPLTITLSSELNEQFLHALDCENKKYKDIIHPGLILNLCSITQSPSFQLQDNVAAVAAKFGSTNWRPLKRGEKISIRWKVNNVYEKRSRLYQISDVIVEDAEGNIVLQREINNTFIGGEYLEKRVKWEKETGYRRAIKKKRFPNQGYEIVGEKKQLTLEKIQHYSGGIPGKDWPARNIHTDREFSIRSGIGRPVASGFMFEAYLHELLADFIGNNWFFSGQLSVAAIDMAGDGDIVVPKATIEKKINDHNESITQYHIWCENQYGNTLMLGSATVKDEK